MVSGMMKKTMITLVLLGCAFLLSNPVVIRGFEAVNKSAPQFFNDFQALGGTVVEYVR